MFNRSWSVLSVLATVALLPLVAHQSGPDSAPSTQTVSVSVSASPVTFGVQVATVIRPLDLAKLTNADFGDIDARN